MQKLSRITDWELYICLFSSGDDDDDHYEHTLPVSYLHVGEGSVGAGEDHVEFVVDGHLSSKRLEEREEILAGRTECGGEYNADELTSCEDIFDK